MRAPTRSHQKIPLLFWTDQHQPKKKQHNISIASSEHTIQTIQPQTNICASMAVLSFASYLLYSYILLPVAFRGLTILYDKRYEICPLVRCIHPLATCLREPSCQDWLHAVAECSDETSLARQQAMTKFAHVQHPEDPAYCQYQSFDSIERQEALDFLECIGRSGCLKPAEFTDTCADLSGISDAILPMESTVPSEVLQGTWNKWYTSGWDLWPCQWTEFWPPAAHQELIEKEGEATTMPSPDPWMTNWPNASDVWRMDLYWQNHHHESSLASTTTRQARPPLTFHMNNEMYLAQTWNFSSSNIPGTTSTPTAATLKTRAVMWGTEAHENWYLLDYHREWQTMLIYYCAYTEAVDRFDSITMVLVKHDSKRVPKNKTNTTDPNTSDSTRTSSGEAAPWQSPVMTQEQSDYFERRARELLGDFHGNLQRISTCNNSNNNNNNNNDGVY